MNRKNMFFVAVLLAVFGLVFMGVTFAQRPARDIDPARHPNLAAAQQSIAEAYGRIDEAQKANGDHLGDHAEKAKALLDQASRELKAAAEYADHHRR